MLDKVYITHHCAALKLRSAQKYNIAPEKCHIGHLLLQGLLERPNTLSQIDVATEESETNLSVATRTMRLADALNKSGLKPGDAVIVMGINHLDLVIPYYAIHYNGISVCPIDTSISPINLQSLFPHVQPKMIFCQQECVEKVENAFKATNQEGRIVVFDDESNNLETFIQEHKGSEVNFRPAEFNHARINAWLMLTSGTTGLPKVAMIPYDTVLNGVCSWWQPFTQRYDKGLVMGTLQWISAQLYFICGPLRGFTRLQCSTPLTAPILIGVINKHKPHITAWTPFFVNQFIIAAEKGLCDLSCFKSILIGGGRIEKPLLDRFQKLCPSTWVYLAYGMTELLVPIFRFDDSVPVNSTGYAKDRYIYKLIDDDGNVVDKPHKSGELWLKGDDFFKGYLNNPEETKKMLTDDGWFKTGDVFYRDERGFYFFVERKRLLIRYFGNWIAPLQIEEVIKRHPRIFEACVVGIPNINSMELPTAAIQRRNGDKVDPEDVFTMIKKCLPDYVVLTGGIFFVDSFPITASGKINRSILRDIAINAKTILPKISTARMNGIETTNGLSYTS